VRHDLDRLGARLSAASSGFPELSSYPQDGGVEPLRLEIYQQTTPTSGWNGAPLAIERLIA
jgi:hypothetical protein